MKLKTPFCWKDVQAEGVTTLQNLCCFWFQEPQRIDGQKDSKDASTALISVEKGISTSLFPAEYPSVKMRWW